MIELIYQIYLFQNSLGCFSLKNSSNNDFLKILSDDGWLSFNLLVSIIDIRKGQTFFSVSCNYGLVLSYILFVEASLKKIFIGSEIDSFLAKIFIANIVRLLYNFW